MNAGDSALRSERHGLLSSGAPTATAPACGPLIDSSGGDGDEDRAARGRELREEGVERDARLEDLVDAPTAAGQQTPLGVGSGVAGVNAHALVARHIEQQRQEPLEPRALRDGDLVAAVRNGRLPVHLGLRWRPVPVLENEALANAVDEELADGALLGQPGALEEQLHHDTSHASAPTSATTRTETVTSNRVCDSISRRCLS
ncbi:unannotated protein [freshwater metagenome]|uniref:Unannotated protein n=1 Tax=freshwater metagenome TaxID=449393 RepID=A0A6J7I9Z9_9ZZZZ